MSTYNGALFLPNALESIAAQTSAEWCLLVRDDCSTDATPDILKCFRQCFPSQVQIVVDEVSRLGPAASFAKLLKQTYSPYVMFCDQDDVWFPDKIKKTMEAMLDAEKRYGSTTPLLVHTDLKVVDENLQPIADSFWKYQNFSPQLSSQLNRLLAQNVVTGCTVMINRALADLATPIQKTAIMHDWWLALVAAAFGKVVYLDEPTILYRQHGKNSVGAKQWGLRHILHKIQNPVEVHKSLLATTCQAQALLDNYGSRMSSVQSLMVKAYADLPYVSIIKRLKTVINYSFFKHGVIRSLGFLVNLLLLKRTKMKSSI